MKRTKKRDAPRKPDGSARVRPATLKQVAADAGVHPSTVSRVLNPGTRDMIADDVALRVQASAKKLGYRPDSVAVSLRTGRSRLVGVLLPDIANLVFPPILSGVTDVLHRSGYSTIIAEVEADRDSQLQLIEQLIMRRVDGLVLATASRNDPVVTYCIERHLPVVLVNRTEAQARVSAVVSDDRKAMQLVMDHLVSLGHRRIGHLAGPATLSTGFSRRQGFELSAQAHKLTAKEVAVETTVAYAREEGVTATRRLLDRHPDLTAIAAANDLLALGAYEVLRERGFKCPQDVSVVGHNDMPLVDIMSPPLTTVRIAHREMGSEAAQLLVTEMTGLASPKRHVVLAPSLVVRGSTAAPPTRRKH